MIAMKQMMTKNVFEKKTSTAPKYFITFYVPLIWYALSLHDLNSYVWYPNFFAKYSKSIWYRFCKHQRYNEIIYSTMITCISTMLMLCIVFKKTGYGRFCLYRGCTRMQQLKIKRTSDFVVHVAYILTYHTLYRVT